MSSGPRDKPPRFTVPGWMRKYTPLLGRVLEQFARVNILDCATRLAAQAFLGAIPAVFVVGALAPEWLRTQLISTLTATLGLTGPALDQVRAVYEATDTAAVTSTGVVGVVVTLLSATACSRALQRTCERSWHLPKAGARLAAWRWVAWLLVWLAALLFQGPLQEAFGIGRALGAVVSLISGTLLWWWTQHLLLGGRVAWLPLLPGAVLVAVGASLVSFGSRFYVPRAMNHSLQQFGSLGLVFVVLSWLIMFFVVVTMGIALGYILAHEPWTARRLGTPDDPPQMLLAEPAAPQPTRASPGPGDPSGDHPR
ncbi:YhjD/YihY/BrkB family envelope integrity protein [Streptomyces sp. NRRL F-2664]|uniref:YhjD/YihY/BrkB family envelope integrity protein n=1 Tax=Streptomyces sp. NRRL F-2664 TaxID=1463842 RepID=UPI001F1C7789|nr:YhjD/YihY/BrkB family envelope integrity protein [Streptomyces sp. NRRL F-2664]